jgi:hypothetical protein
MFQHGDKLIVCDNEVNRESRFWRDKIGTIVTFNRYGKSREENYVWIKEHGGGGFYPGRFAFAKEPEPSFFD